MPRTPKPAPTCIDCGAPAIERPGKPPRCARHAAMAQQIADQQADAVIAAIRALKAERKEQEKAA